MRQILFRGKRVTNGKWVEGYYFYSKVNRLSYIVIGLGTSREYCHVHSKSIGQYTGLMDKNGKMIFEGDVLSAKSYNYDFMDNHLYRIIYVTKEMSFKMLDLVTRKEEDVTGFCDLHIRANLQDNPELFK